MTIFDKIKPAVPCKAVGGVIDGVAPLTVQGGWGILCPVSEAPWASEIETALSRDAVAARFAPPVVWGSRNAVTATRRRAAMGPRPGDRHQAPGTVPPPE
ncbi:hypothetical protein VCV18_001322 [Metarhizium anisopliae]